MRTSPRNASLENGTNIVEKLSRIKNQEWFIKYCSIDAGLQRYSGNVFTNNTITGSTVVLTCCKGDGQSQWKTPIFGASQLGNPLTDFDKI